MELQIRKVYDLGEDGLVSYPMDNLPHSLNGTFKCYGVYGYNPDGTQYHIKDLPTLDQAEKCVTTLYGPVTWGWKLFRLIPFFVINFRFFINKTKELPMGKIMPAEDHPTKGFAHRPGWHCTSKPEAPHLSEKGRVWLMVRLYGEVVKVDRPASQGGQWFLAEHMEILQQEIPI